MSKEEGHEYSTFEKVLDFFLLGIKHECLRLYRISSISFQKIWGVKWTWTLLEQPGDTHIHNMFYNGWKIGHYVSNVIFFILYGLISSAVFNSPGFMYESHLLE